MPGHVVDGNDVLAVATAMWTAAERARAGEGPTVIEARTYRHYGHSRSDPAKYRPVEEVEAWLKRDPLTVLRAQLRELGVEDAAIDQAGAAAEQTVAAAVDAANAAPEADPAEALTDVWADGGAAWRT
jgi:acetoin:2,6-dichlorophenolindophenol oxidoreductase subunit alpha